MQPDAFGLLQPVPLSKLRASAEDVPFESGLPYNRIELNDDDH